MTYVNDAEVDTCIIENRMCLISKKENFIILQVFDDMGQDVTPKSLLQIDPTVK